jgi:beta-glucosidase/6-phospho-beta-glucosidase/beta-galactosidase
VRFGPEFAWGVASSAFQSEGGDVANDWVDAARAGRVPPNPGNGFLERAEADFALVASLGLRHYRLRSSGVAEPDRAVSTRRRSTATARSATPRTPPV